jgi:hypothetical protein
VAVGIRRNFFAVFVFNGARSFALTSELCASTEFSSSLSVAITSGKAPSLGSVGNLAGDVLFGVIGHEATRIWVASFTLSRISNLVGCKGPVRIAFTCALLIGEDQTEAAASFLIQDTGGSQ